MVPLAAYVQLEAIDRVRKLEKELKLDKDVRMSMTLLASELADKARRRKVPLNRSYCFYGSHEVSPSVCMFMCVSICVVFE